MATILAHIEVHPGKEGDFEKIVSDLFQATSEESGMRHYEYWRSAQSSQYYCLLAFDDFDAFLTHQTSEHHEVASPKLGELMSKIRLEWVDPVQGASRLPTTRMQPLASDADDLRKRYHRLFAATLQDWWMPLRGDAGD